ncbi:hypothetical protein N3K66_007657 [Trichothecium roseum]|uniref:Uncharacterized protein n=1 Tax=Trichothecium roseum TaxID=47278 RepID=A0ACC0UUK5_9HYPO|nr:hypothetical protein N3K66_007657 [Trichothecium roseum]
MASIQVTALRHIGRHAVRHHIRPLNQQRRWAQVHDVRVLTTTRPYGSIAEKYQSKLSQKARIEGYSTVEELKKAYSDRIEASRRKDAAEFPEAQHVIPQAPDTPVSQPFRGELDVERDGGSSNDGLGTIPQAPETPVKQPHKGDLPKSELEPGRGSDGGAVPQAPDTPISQPNKGPVDAAARRAVSGEKPAVKGLDDIIDLEKARELPDKELTAIWRLRHANSENKLCAVVPAPSYRAMEEAARASPQFVLPVPHESQGAEIHFLQWVWDAQSKTSTVLFTQLAEYKNRGEFAQPHTTVTHHLDLVDERGLVLLQGQIANDKVCTPEQAKWLLMCLQRFYGGWEGEAKELTGDRKQRAEERKKLLEYFTTGDSRFSVERLMEEAERMG